MHQVCKRLVEKIRFHHISLDYLACIVASCNFASLNDMATSIFQSALVNRNIGKSVAKEDNVDLGPKNRGSKGRVWVFSSKLMLEDLLKNTDKKVGKMIGLAGCVPVMLSVLPDKEGNVGVYVRFVMPHSRKRKMNGCLERMMGFKVTVKLGSLTESLSYLFDHSSGYGFADFFSKPWSEVVCAGSSYFPGGKLAVELSVTKKEGGKE